MSERIVAGAVEPIIATVTDQSGIPLTDRANILVKVWRTSDGNYLDWSDMTFKTGAAVVQLLQQMAEVDRAYSPGEYRTDLDTGLIANQLPDDNYHVVVLQTPSNGAGNLPQFGELRLGQWVAEAVSKPYQVLQSFSYNALLATLTGMVWVEYHNLVFNTPSSVEVTWYNASGAVLFVMTDAAPDAQGVFKVSRSSTPLALNTSYYAIARVTVPGIGLISGGKGIFTVG
jgi:hypothetical protein